MKNSNDLRNDLEQIREFAIANCEGEFHVLPFVVMYLYANERICFVKAKELEDINDPIVIYKDLNEAFCNGTITSTEQEDYNNEVDIYALTAKFEKKKTDVYIQFALEKTLNILKGNNTFHSISDSTFKLYNLLSAYPCQLIKSKLAIICSDLLDYFSFFIPDIKRYYKGIDQTGCDELNNLMLELLTIDKKDEYTIAHPQAGPINFINHVKNYNYIATFKDFRFLCVYQILFEITKKNANVLYADGDGIEIEKFDADHILIDDISIGFDIWQPISDTAYSKERGIFLVESDALYEIKNKNKGIDGIDLLNHHIDTIVFLPKGLSIISVCKQKSSKNVSLIDETRYAKIDCALTLNDIVNGENSYTLTDEEYTAPDFVFELNRILGKRAIKVAAKKNFNSIQLGELLSPSNEIGVMLNRRELDFFDHDFTPFHPYYIAENGIVVNKSEAEARKKGNKCVLLLDLLSKHKFQPKMLFYDKFAYTLAMFGAFAFTVREDIVNLNYLVNEMNKQYFIDQIFPSNDYVYVSVDWEYLSKCRIYIPDSSDTTTPIERQRLLLNADKMEFIDKLLRSYDYDVEKIVNGEKGGWLKNGSTLFEGQYEIVKPLGNGGFGKTYKAIRINEDGSKTIVAIKEFFDEELQRREKGSNNVLCLSKDIKDITVVRNKFFKEAEKIRNFSDCENIIKVNDVFDENNTSYYSMEYIDGENLNDYIQKHGVLEEKEAVRIIKGVANALKRMHSDRMLHMDVKPKNIMISKEGRVVLIDFGGAHKYNISSQDNSTFARISSPGFTPPEPASSVRFSPPYDIYSLGATLHYMLSGAVYDIYSENSQQGSKDSGNPMQYPFADNVSEETNKCKAKSLEFLPKDRQQNIDEFLAMLPGE